MYPPSLLDYYLDHRCSPQWKDFLAALGAEFSDALPEADLRLLMRRIGTRFADAHPLDSCDTLELLQSTMNLYWHALDWGFVTFVEMPDHLEIRHYAAPIASGFGPKAHWADGFLEGVYLAWFLHQGMAEGLAIRKHTDARPQADTPHVTILKMARD